MRVCISSKYKVPVPSVLLVYGVQYTWKIAIPQLIDCLPHEQVLGSLKSLNAKNTSKQFLNYISVFSVVQLLKCLFDVILETMTTFIKLLNLVHKHESDLNVPTTATMPQLPLPLTVQVTMVKNACTCTWL